MTTQATQPPSPPATRRCAPATRFGVVVCIAAALLSATSASVAQSQAHAPTKTPVNTSAESTQSAKNDTTTSEPKPGTQPASHPQSPSSSTPSPPDAASSDSASNHEENEQADEERNREETVSSIGTSAASATQQGAHALDSFESDPWPNDAGSESMQGASRLRYELERIEVRGNDRTSSRVVLRFVKFAPGSVLDVDDPELDLLRYRLLGTGFFKQVSLSLRKGSKAGHVVLIIDVVERNTVVLSDIWMGLSADADAKGNARPLSGYAGLDAAETNLFGTGILLGSGIGFAQDQFAIRVRLFDPALAWSNWMLATALQYNHALEFYGNRDVQYTDAPTTTSQSRDYAPVRYNRLGGSIGIGRDFGSAVQGWLEYRLDRVDATLPLAASHRRGLDIVPIEFGLTQGLSVLSALKLSFIYDTRDYPVLPRTGSLTTASADIALAPFGSDYSYQKYTLSSSRWFTLPWQHVLRLGAFAGAISGNAPVFERFYVGDLSDLLPSRMLGLNVDRRPSHNFLKTDIIEIRYGTYAAKVFGEYRIPLYRSSRSIYGIDIFALTGLFGLADEQDITNPPSGYSAWRRIPIDLTFNLGLQMDTSAGGFAFAFSNVLGFIPMRREGQP